MDQQTGNVSLSKNNPAVQSVMGVQNKYTAALMKKKNVIGTATGLNENGKLAILVLMAKQDGDEEIPVSLDGVPVKKRVTGILTPTFGKAAAGMSASPSSVQLSKATSVSVQLSGGTPPYTVKTAPNSKIAKATLSGSTLTITGVASGKTSVTIRDKAKQFATVTVPITVIQPSPLTASPNSVTVPPSSQTIVQLSGGTVPYSIKSYPTSGISTATINGNELVLTGVATGATSVVVRDNAATPANVTVSITVNSTNPIAVSTNNVGMQTNEQRTVTISGGVTPYSIRTMPNGSIATVTISGGMVTIRGLAAGSTSVVVQDNAGVRSTATIAITVTASGSVTDPRAKQSPPIKLGASGGWQYDWSTAGCCAGTLGGLITDGTRQYILSCYHVMQKDIVPGANNRVATIGDPIIQPGLADAGCNAGAAQVVALLRSLPSLPSSSVDASIAEVVGGMVDPTGAILGIGTLSRYISTAYINQSVKKSGRTTGVTTSNVIGINGTVSVNYANECGGATQFSKTFTGQIIVDNPSGVFSTSGDSGSLLVENVPTNPRTLGLIFAGAVTVAVANPIEAVLAHFSAEFGRPFTMVGQ